jgi:hypothetical protein
MFEFAQMLFLNPVMFCYSFRGGFYNHTILNIYELPEDGKSANCFED